MFGVGLITSLSLRIPGFEVEPCFITCVRALTGFAQAKHLVTLVFIIVSTCFNQFVRSLVLSGLQTTEPSPGYVPELVTCGRSEGSLWNRQETLQDARDRILKRQNTLIA